MKFPVKLIAFIILFVPTMIVGILGMPYRLWKALG